MNTVPIDQEGIGIDGLRVGVKLLHEGKGVAVFPEGSRTPDGRIHPLMPGIQLLIKRGAAPVVPVGIAGAYDAWPIWRKYPIPSPLFLPATERTIAASIGPPLDGRRLASLPREKVLNELFDALQTMHARADRLRRQPP
jgi:1-acyl-sn-glycerol-3-phosphate acyltransferase